jgi:hypothetical protein
VRSRSFRYLTQLLVSKNGSEVQRVYAGIVATSLFGIDIPSSSQGVQFGSESSGTEADDEVELGKVFGPVDLALGKEFGRCEVLQVLVVSNHVDWSS